MESFTRNCLVVLTGVLSTTMLSGLTWIITQNIDTGKHLVKIDMVLEYSANRVPALVEEKLSELRTRLNLSQGQNERLQDQLNLIQQRMASIEVRPGSLGFAPKAPGDK